SPPRPCGFAVLALALPGPIVLVLHVEQQRDVGRRKQLVLAFNLVESKGVDRPEVFHEDVRRRRLAQEFIVAIGALINEHAYLVVVLPYADERAAPLRP